MANENFIEKLAAGLSQSASVKNVYGEPIQSGDKTIIPVACISYGLGGGYGQGKKPRKPSEHETTLERPEGEGAGGGGGMYARAKGIYEITPTSTRFIPVNGGREILLGVVIGFLVKALFFSRAGRK
jgi:uncharacterized spore protein YtfJ